MGNYSIKDIESLTGIKAHTIRIWEQRYGIVAPHRTDTNIRYYSDRDLRLLMNAAILNKNGIKISRIITMTPQQLSQEVIRFAFSKSDFPLQIDALMGTMIEFDEDKFEKILSNNILQSGFEKTIINIVFPFLQRTGLMWLTGAVTSVQEHFVSNLIRQKIIVAIDALPLRYHESAKKVVLFLPEFEQHELGLLFTCFLFKARGYHVLYLGQQTPAADMELVVKNYRPDYMFTSLTSSAPIEAMNQYIQKLAELDKSIPIFISGNQVISHTKHVWPSNVQKILTFDEVYAMFDKGAPVLKPSK